MDGMKRLILEKMRICLGGIQRNSSPNTDLQEAEAVEHLARAYSYLCQIRED